MGIPVSKLRRIVRHCQPRVLIRLTYPALYPDPEKSLAHLKRIVGYLKDQKNAGFWVRDIQSRGAPFFWLLVSRYVPKDQLAKTWYEIVGSADPAHLKAGTSVSGFQFERGYEQFLKKTILPGIKTPGFRYGTFGSWKAKLLSWF